MTITLIYTGLLALIFLALSIVVINGRRAGGISLGDGGLPGMQRKIRGHANFAEYVPLLLVMLGFLELHGELAAWSLHAMGLVLVASRLLHGVAFGATQNWMLGRVLGTVMTLSLLAVMGALSLWHGLIH